MLGWSGCIILGFCFLKWSTLVLHCNLGKKMQSGFYCRRWVAGRWDESWWWGSSKLSLVLSRLQTTTHAGSEEDLGWAHSTFLPLCLDAWHVEASKRNWFPSRQFMWLTSISYTVAHPWNSWEWMSLDIYWPWKTSLLAYCAKTLWGLFLVICSNEDSCLWEWFLEAIWIE